MVSRRLCLSRASIFIINSGLGRLGTMAFPGGFLVDATLELEAGSDSVSVSDRLSLSVTVSGTVLSLRTGIRF